MSKVKRINGKSSSYQKQPLNISQTLSSIHPLAVIDFQDRQSQYFESPYASKQPKNRSLTNLKDRPFQPIGIPSPALESSITTNLKIKSKSKIHLNPSIFSKSKEDTENPSRLKKKLIFTDIKKSDILTQSLDLKLSEIYLKHKECGISIELLEKYSEIFEEIICKDKNFGNLLSKIKFAYDDWIKLKKNSTSEISKVKSDIVEFSRKLSEEIEENKRLHKKIQKISRENVDLGRELEERDNHCRVMQEHLLKVTRIDIQDVPQDSNSWKVMVLELQNASERCGILKKKLKILKSKEKALMKLFWILKQKGYPVEDLYDKYCSKKKKNKDEEHENSGLGYAQTNPQMHKAALAKLNRADPDSFIKDFSSQEDDKSN